MDNLSLSRAKIEILNPFIDLQQIKPKLGIIVLAKSASTATIRNEGIKIKANTLDGKSSKG